MGLMSRAMMSAASPGGYGTMTRTGLVGYDCAAAPVQNSDTVLDEQVAQQLVDRALAALLVARLGIHIVRAGEQPATFERRQLARMGDDLIQDVLRNREIGHVRWCRRRHNRRPGP